MKRFVSVLLMLVFALSLTAAAAAEESAPDLTLGGWEIYSHRPVMLPTEEIQVLFDKATGDIDGATYIPVALMGKQVVAGTNYCILSQIVPVVPDAKPTWALVYIYADLQGNAEIRNVYELYIDRHSEPVK